ncbi:hypothetical protein Hanom_Chr00s002680g01703181 [Helianthus anomalus]
MRKSSIFNAALKSPITTQGVSHVRPLNLHRSSHKLLLSWYLFSAYTKEQKIFFLTDLNTICV